MRIVLYGNGSAKNHGCEAIVRGTKEVLNDESFVILSADCNEDKEYGMDSISSIKEAKNPVKKNLDFVRAYLKLKLKKDYTELDGLQYLQAIRECKGNTDVAFSIGGDNYCYGYSSLYDYMNRAFNKFGVPTVLWGCSIEPKVTEDPQVAEDLRRYRMIVARESITYEAVKKIGANAIRIPDPAFYMQVKECALDEHFSTSKVVGVNISPMIISNEKCAGMAYKNYQRMIEYILDNTDASVALIPHVVWKTNDDRLPLIKLYEEYKHTNRVFMVEDHCAEELKYIISHCDFFVGARTHSTIAAYSTAVPTLVVGYSVKARGIARDLFGTEEGYVLPVQELKEETNLTDAFVNLYSQKEMIRKNLEGFLPEYKKAAEGIKEKIESVVKK